jgi:cytochrome c5
VLKLKVRASIVNNRLKSTTVKLIGLLILGVALSANAVSDKNRAAIEERIQPVGSLCLEGDSSCGSAVAAGGGAAKSVDEIYNSTCMACHATGVAGAPKMGDVAAWSARIDQGLDVLYTHAIDGLNGMPAKGLCMTCSDDDVKAVVDYMIEKSQ